MKAIIENLQKQGFPTDIETTSRQPKTGQRFDALILHFGWHSHNLLYFSRSDIKFPPGAWPPFTAFQHRAYGRIPATQLVH